MPLAFWVVEASLVLAWYVAGCGGEPVVHSPADSALVAIRSLRSATSTNHCAFWPGLHADPAAGGEGLAVSDRRTAATPMGLGGIAFASFALPDQLQSAAPWCPPAFQLAGDACERDHGELRSFARGISLSWLCCTDRDEALSYAAARRQRWPAGCFCGRYRFCSVAIGSAEHQ